MNVKRKLDSEFSSKYWNFDKKFDLRVSMVMIWSEDRFHNNTPEWVVMAYLKIVWIVMNELFISISGQKINEVSIILIKHLKIAVDILHNHFEIVVTCLGLDHSAMKEVQHIKEWQFDTSDIYWYLVNNSKGHREPFANRTCSTPTRLWVGLKSVSCNRGYEMWNKK